MHLLDSALHSLYLRLIPRFGRSAATTYCWLRRNAEPASICLSKAREQVARIGSNYGGGQEAVEFRRLGPDCVLYSPMTELSPYRKLKAQGLSSIIDVDGFDRIEVFSNGSRFLVMDPAHAVKGEEMIPVELTPVRPTEVLPGRPKTGKGHHEAVANLIFGDEDDSEMMTPEEIRQDLLDAGIDPDASWAKVQPLLDKACESLAREEYRRRNEGLSMP